MKHMVDILCDHITPKVYLLYISGVAGGAMSTTLFSENNIRYVILWISLIGAILGVALGTVKIVREVKAISREASEGEDEPSE